MTVAAELLEALRQSHGYWLDSIGARIATIERFAAAADCGDDAVFVEELRAAREARANSELLCTQMQAYYAERVS